MYAVTYKSLKHVIICLLSCLIKNNNKKKQVFVFSQQCLVDETEISFTKAFYSKSINKNTKLLLIIISNN